MHLEDQLKVGSRPLLGRLSMDSYLCPVVACDWLGGNHGQMIGYVVAEMVEGVDSIVDCSPLGKR